jgi:hypothetical protein
MGPDTKSYSANGVYERITVLTLELAASSTDVDVDNVGHRVKA